MLLLPLINGYEKNEGMTNSLLVKSCLLICLCFISVCTFGQQNTTPYVPEVIDPTIFIRGFADVFYAYDLNQPETNFRQPFLYNHNRHNEFNLNLGLIKLGMLHEKYRANLALQTGTYANDNYAAEPGVLKHVFEASAGLSLSQKNNLWLDAGIFPSHIGFESAISMDNFTLTRSLLAENSPYFLSGAKLTFNPDDRWEIAGIVCNGWQRIQRVEGNSLLSFGTQVTYSPNDKTTLNWSTFTGTDDPDAIRRMRYFNNLYGKFELTEKIGLIAGFDTGMQQQKKNSSDYDVWLSPVLIARYAFSDNWAAALRAEYYQDKTGIIISTETPNGFKTTGLSANLDYTPFPQIACRLEGRWLNSRDNIFVKENSVTDNNFFVVGSIAVKFEK